MQHPKVSVHEPPDDASGTDSDSSSSSSDAKLLSSLGVLSVHKGAGASAAAIAAGSTSLAPGQRRRADSAIDRLQKVYGEGAIFPPTLLSIETLFVLYQDTEGTEPKFKALPYPKNDDDACPELKRFDYIELTQAYIDTQRDKPNNIIADTGYAFILMVNPNSKLLELRLSKNADGRYTHRHLAGMATSDKVLSAGEVVFNSDSSVKSWSLKTGFYRKTEETGY